jgi:deaminated glutathione amidase
MKTFLLQMNCVQDKEKNIEQARSILDRFLEPATDLIVFPENWTSLGGSRETKWQNAEVLPDTDDPAATGSIAYEWLRGLAREHGCHVHGGSMPERVGERLFNTTIVFDPSGAEIARYRKIHLFDVVTPDGQVYGESQIIDAGDAVVTFKLGEFTAGCAICYDIRFPELFRALRDRGADLIFLPAAFTLLTGKDHWEPLIRARAIETQCWFGAPGTWGPHLDAAGATRHTYGHSLVCDPWGQVVACASDGVGAVSARLDIDAVARVREQIPIAHSRRLPSPGGLC